jgi:hypothetical protein
MKKCTKNNKLAFGKATVTELNKETMTSVNGGSVTLFVYMIVNQAVHDYIDLTIDITRPDVISS